MAAKKAKRGSAGRPGDGSLAEYRRKRDFRTTPEPEGTPVRVRPKGQEPTAERRATRGTGQELAAGRRAARRKGRAPSFCVHKHLATHLHYDFRLEHNGVLLSWAVPKGPSLDPADKRLAMRTEDHPLDYRGFEGVIPEGYGAGIVLLWDEGTWEPRSPDVGAALEKGELKFALDGVKLKGSWVLVCTGRDRTRERWLLIKHRDEWAGEVDITAFAPLSVKSFGDFEDVLARSPEFRESDRLAARAAGAGMLATIVRRAVRLKSQGEARKPPARKKPARRR